MSLILMLLALFFGLILVCAGLRLLRPARAPLPRPPGRGHHLGGIRAVLD